MSAHPPTLSPPTRWSSRFPPQAMHRLVAAVVFALGLGVLLVAWGLTPSPTGMGTHEQLGLLPCGFKMATGVPCATCGMTTSFSYAAHGELWLAFVTQPAGAVLAVATAMAVLVSAWALISGMSLAQLGRGLARPRVGLLAAAMLLVAWGYTIVVHLVGS